MAPSHRDSPSRDVPLLVVGVDHHCAPLELREQVSYDNEAAEETLVRLIAHGEIEEAMLLSTCNRTEAYLRGHDDHGAYRLGLEHVFLARAPEIEEEGRFFVKRKGEAAHHLLSVAAGLESMVLGEPEILGQVKQAVTLAETLGTSGTVLQRLARSALTAGKRARAETAIGAGAVSFGYAAVELAKNIFLHLEGCSILVLGAGQTAVAVSRSLMERGASELKVANRSPERARQFQQEFPETEILPFDRRFEAVAKADLVVAATSAPEAILTRNDLATTMRERRSRPLLIVDLGVPRDIDPKAGSLRNLFLHDIDSLEQLIDRNLKRRREEVPKVSRIVDEELELYENWIAGLAAGPLVAELHRRAEDIRRQELQARRDRFPADIESELEDLTRAIVRKILHHPSTQLRQRSGAGNLGHLAAVRELFRLEGHEPDG